MNRLAFLQTTVGALGAPALPFFDRIDRIVPIAADPDSLIRNRVHSAVPRGRPAF